MRKIAHAAPARCPLCSKDAVRHEFVRALRLALGKVQSHARSLAISSVLGHKDLSKKLACAKKDDSEHGGSARDMLRAELRNFPAPADHPPMPLHDAVKLVLADAELCAMLRRYKMEVVYVENDMMVTGLTYTRHRSINAEELLRGTRRGHLGW